MDWKLFLKEFVGQEWVKAALGVIVGYLLSLIPSIPPEVKVAIAAIIVGLIGFYAAYKANRVARGLKA
jgi:xanthosine utilization system XapX-like protein